MGGLAIGLLCTTRYSSRALCLFDTNSTSNETRCTKPGGYFEQMEIDIMIMSDDGTVTKDHFMARWSQTLLDAAEKTGKTLTSYDTMTEQIKAAGFEDVEERAFKMPIGAWSSDPRMKMVGRWNLLFCIEGADSWALYLLSQVMKVSVLYSYSVPY